MNLLVFTAEVVDPAAVDEARRAPLSQTRPGFYEADMQGPGQDDSLSILVREEGTGNVVWRSRVDRSYPREFARLGANWPNLRKVAELSGGSILSSGQLPARLTGRERSGFVDLWPFLVAISLGAMLMDWSMGRVGQGMRQRRAAP